MERVGEHEFILATEIGRFGDIAVMAEIQRNVGIAVALSGIEVPRGIAISKKDVTMKTTKLLTAVSAAALLGLSSFALAQSTGGGAGSSGMGGSGATGASPSTQAPSGAGTSSTQNSPSGGSAAGERAQNRDSMSKDGMKSNQAQGKEMDKDGMKSDRAQQGMGKDAQKSNQAQTPSDSKSQMSQDKDGAKSGSTVGAASSGSVNLTTEQRTTIRKEVLTTNAPRATNINFQVNVGTVVPSTVRVVEVPATIVKIHPQWKGYRYFVYNDEIIIVEPRTLKIVAVLEV